MRGLRRLVVGLIGIALLMMVVATAGNVVVSLPSGERTVPVQIVTVLPPFTWEDAGTPYGYRGNDGNIYNFPSDSGLHIGDTIVVHRDSRDDSYLGADVKGTYIGGAAQPHTAILSTLLPVLPLFLILIILVTASSAAVLRYAPHEADLREDRSGSPVKASGTYLGSWVPLALQRRRGLVPVAAIVGFPVVVQSNGARLLLGAPLSSVAELRAFEVAIRDTDRQVDVEYFPRTRVLSRLSSATGAAVAFQPDSPIVEGIPLP